MKTGRAKVIDIVMTRDNLDIMTATEMVDNTIKMINKAIENNSYCDVDDILQCELGLEPDYIIDLIDL